MAGRVVQRLRRQATSGPVEEVAADPDEPLLYLRGIRLTAAQAEVAVTVRAVNERELPAADDAFAETTGFASFDELSQPWDLWMALIKAACFGFLAMSFSTLAELAVGFWLRVWYWEM